MNNAATSSSPVSGPGTSTRNPSARRPPPLAKVTVASNCARYSSTLMPRAHLFRSAVRQTSVLGRFLAAPGHDVRSTCSDLGHRPLRQGDRGLVRTRLSAGRLEELDADPRPLRDAHDVDGPDHPHADDPGAGYCDGQPTGTALRTQRLPTRHGAFGEHT